MDNQEKNTNETVTETTEAKKAPAKKKSSGNGPVRIIILVVCLAVFAFSGFKIVSEIIDGANTGDMYDELQNTVRDDEIAEDDGKDDVNVPPAPIDPNVSGSGPAYAGNEDKTEEPENTTFNSL